MKQIIINSEELQVRVAVVDDGKLQDFFMERKNKDRIVGSIFKGRIKNLEPSLQAAFVDIGVGKNAFLHYWDMTPDADALLEEDDEPKKSQKGGRKANEAFIDGILLDLAHHSGHSCHNSGRKIAIQLVIRRKDMDAVFFQQRASLEFRFAHGDAQRLGLLTA